MLILVGSKALAYHIDPIYWDRVMGPDIDVIGTYDEVIQTYAPQPQMYPTSKGKHYVLRGPNRIIDAELAWPDSAAEKFTEIVSEDSGTSMLNTKHLLPGLDLLYLLKMSHRYLRNSPHFLKTMGDIHLMRKHGAKIPEQYKAFYKERMKETYWYVHPKLKDETAKTFFKTQEESFYVYNHDDIHQAVAIGSVPAYTMYMQDGAQVNCDKGKFLAHDESVRLNGVLEEAYVLALERHQIPNNFKYHAKLSFDIALSKVCSSITSGWFRAYSWEHYYQVQDLYRQLNSDNSNYVTRFQDALSKGQVRLIKE